MSSSIHSSLEPGKLYMISLMTMASESENVLGEPKEGADGASMRPRGSRALVVERMVTASARPERCWAPA